MQHTVSQAYHSPHYSPRLEAVSAIVLHHGAGTRKSDLAWLCNPASKVSAHYYVCRDGDIFQLVSEASVAWHAGIATISNQQSIGIETEHTTLPDLPIQHTDWPQAQLDALAWLTNDIAKRYQISSERIVSHRAIALPKGRKNDPAHPPLGPEPLFRAWVAGLPTTPAPSNYTELSPILGTPKATRAQLRFTVHKKSFYTQQEVDTFFDLYWKLATETGVDSIIPIAQMLHETADLTSFWCARPQRNPAGIGVNGVAQQREPNNKNNWAYNTQRNQWERGVSFPTWVSDAIPAHLGRLLQYAIIIGGETPEQRVLMYRSSATRPFPPRARGSAPQLRELGYAHNPALAGWAKPGDHYGAAIAKRANVLMGVLG